MSKEAETALCQKEKAEFLMSAFSIFMCTFRDEADPQDKQSADTALTFREQFQPS